MARDPFSMGEPRGTRTREKGNLAWWNNRDPGYRLVGKVDGVFGGPKVDFVKFTDAIIFRTADHKPLAFYPEVAVNSMDAKVRAEDAGAWCILTAVGTREGKKAGVTFVTYETRVIAAATPEGARIAALHERAAKRLAEEAAMSPLPDDDYEGDDDLPF